MSHTKKTIRNVKKFIAQCLSNENETIYEAGDKILRINKNKSTFFEEYFVEESWDRFVMRIHGCFHCLYQFRTNVRKYLQDIKEELEQEGFFVEIILDNTGEIYIQTTHHITDSAPSIETLDNMYLQLLKVLVDYEIYLRLISNGYQPGEETCEKLKHEEEYLLIQEVRKKAEKRNSPDELDIFNDDERWKQFVKEWEKEYSKQDSKDIPKNPQNPPQNTSTPSSTNDAPPFIHDNDCTLDEFARQLMSESTDE